MYQVVLFLHGLLRWVVVVAAVVALVRALRGKEYTAADGKAGLVLTAALDTQVLLGLVLYTLLSPITHAAFADMAHAMKNSALRFYVVEHVFSMTLALAFAHIGRVRVRKVEDAVEKLRRARLWHVLTVVALIVGAPWPGLPYGRPLWPHF